MNPNHILKKYPERLFSGSFLKFDINRYIIPPTHNRDKDYYIKFKERNQKQFSHPKFQEVIYGKSVTVEITQEKRKELLLKFIKFINELEEREEEYSKKYNLSSKYQNCKEQNKIINLNEVFPKDVDIVEALNRVILDKSSEEEEQAIFAISDLRAAYFGTALEKFKEFVKELKELKG